ncbi:putative molybdopterin binding domain-containing protein [Hirsutella rhossiliensis]|uniref:Molybdopterin binding domain-containing protein n=1 Tax=Hirsutella rhossiliensis TaxID=111463 RepID=A0A9P8SJU7_9HYPO|nr:putative molybdopterin binding domain-containing protein [Hirsutella rhossiliensis]KAH0964549.1 putative molybdopterin binding domain-containing protein [Hirsutella rhossiliensis]
MDRDASPPLTAAILVVSTTAAQGLSTDASSAILRQVLSEDGGGKWQVSHEAIVPDDVLLIQKHVLAWAADPNPPHLIVTTGGTGFATADGTPEAIAPLLHKQAPGLVQAMLAASLSVTPFAMMSRPVAGVRHRSVIVTLPGSPKGAKENLQAIIKTLPHACLQVCGADSRALHAGGVKKLEADAGIQGGSRPPEHASGHDHHHHHHGHGHGVLVRHTSQALSNDPQLGPTRRHRESPYPMLSVDDALALIAEHTPGPEVVARSVDEKLVGSVLAEAVRAQEDVPAFRASIVDGYAAVVPKGGNMTGAFPVTAVSHATPGQVKPLKEGEVARITTGAPLPPGAASVIMVEDTILKAMTDDGTEEREIEMQADGVKEGENVREVGSDIQKDSVILDRGEQITGVGGEIGLLAAVGVAEVKVFRRPVIGVLSTGDEIIEHSRPGPLRLGEVRDTNRITLISAVREWGFDVVDLGIAKDTPGTLEETLRSGLRQADVLVTTGGVSMGELDLLKPTVERALGGTIHFGRVAMKPGKPTTFATVPVKDNAGRRVSKAVFSLPGNPASALVTFHLFVLPSLHKQSGISPAGLPRVPVVLAHEFPIDPRPEYHRAVVTVGADGQLTAGSTGGQRSSKVGSLRSANALVCMPSGKGKLEKGTRVDALLMSTIRGA